MTRTTDPFASLIPAAGGAPFRRSENAPGPNLMNKRSTALQLISSLNKD